MKTVESKWDPFFNELYYISTNFMVLIMAYKGTGG
jgi:hypothetical protein